MVGAAAHLLMRARVDKDELILPTPSTCSQVIHCQLDGAEHEQVTICRHPFGHAGRQVRPWQKVMC